MNKGQPVTLKEVLAFSLYAVIIVGLLANEQAAKIETFIKAVLEYEHHV